MAAVHLLQRELLHILASASRPTSTRYHHLDTVPSLQWPRFKSDYRRVDTAVAREFDRPMAGYGYPASSSMQAHIEESSFMEEDTQEYIAPFASTRKASTLLADTENTSFTSAHSTFVQAGGNGAIARIVRCAEDGDLWNAVNWLSQTPRPSASMAVAEYQKAVRTVQTSLLAHQASNISLLLKFALCLAVNGLALHSARRPLLAHLARYSGFERLRPFWIDYTMHARQFASERGLMARIRLERHLDSTANVMVRAQCLAGRHVDAYNFLKHVRDEQTRGISYHSGTHRKRPSPTIEEFTYSLLLEEMSRHKAHPQLLEDTLSLAKRDWPEPIFPMTTLSESKAWKARSKPETTFGRTRMRYYEYIGDLNAGREPDAYLANRIVGPARRFKGLRALPALIQRNLAVRNSKAAYASLTESIHEGVRPSVEAIQAFTEICRREGADYLVQAM